MISHIKREIFLYGIMVCLLWHVNGLHIYFLIPTHYVFSFPFGCVINVSKSWFSNSISFTCVVRGYTRILEKHAIGDGHGQYIPHCRRRGVTAVETDLGQNWHFLTSLERRAFQAKEFRFIDFPSQLYIKWTCTVDARKKI